MRFMILTGPVGDDDSSRSFARYHTHSSSSSSSLMFAIFSLALSLSLSLSPVNRQVTRRKNALGMLSFVVDCPSQPASQPEVPHLFFTVHLSAQSLSSPQEASRNKHYRT